VNFVHVPYKGSLSFNAVMAGEVSLTFISVVSGLPQVKARRVIALAVTSKNRSRAMPELPTVAEAGVAGFEATNWFGVLAPHLTPKPIIARLSTLIAAQTAAPDVRARLLSDGAEPVGSTPEEFSALIKTELKRWGEIVKRSGAKVD